MTYKEFLQSISENMINEEVIAEAQRLLTNLEEKEAKRRAKSQGKNDEIKQIVLKILADRVLTSKEIKTEKSDWDITTQKLSGVLSQMFRNGELKRHDNGSNKPYSYEIA